MVLIECGAGVSGMLRLGGTCYWCQECVVAGAWVSYERDVMSFGAMCELYEEVVCYKSWLGTYDLFLQKNEEKKGGCCYDGGASMGDNCGSLNQ